MSDEYAAAREQTKREIIEQGLRRIEVEGLADKAWRVRPATNINLVAPPNVRHSVTGRYGQLQAPADLVEIGRYFSLARRRAGISQQRLGTMAGVSQSMISRFERGLAPAMGVRHLVALSKVLGQLFPFGVCPHEHVCGWQPRKPPEQQISYVERWLDLLLSAKLEPSTASQPDTDVEIGTGMEIDTGIEVTLADLSVSSVDGPAE